MHSALNLPEETLEQALDFDALEGAFQANSQQADIFYTTGRLTSEMVLKVAQMGISVLVSRSGVTQKGVELAERFGVMLIARAKGKSFQAINAEGRLTLDAIPPKPPSARSSKEAGI